MSEFRAIDRAIVDLLMDDGRLSCADIARQIGGVSERTVRYRLERMLELGILQVRAIPNPKALGYSVVADVFIQVEPGAIADVAQILTHYECVSYVGCSMGDNDISIQVVAHDNAEVYSFVTKVVDKLPGVRKTTAVIVPLILKDVYKWRIPASACTDGSGGLEEKTEFD
jgi:DNA-binding Lrp family transcriptional regulator